MILPVVRIISFTLGTAITNDTSRLKIGSMRYQPTVASAATKQILITMAGKSIDFILFYFTLQNKGRISVNTNISGIGGGIHSTWGKTVFDTSEGKFGIYSNIADYGADDIFTNAQNTSINLPDPTTMNVVGFEVPKENQFWAQDYIEGDTNYGNRPSSAPALSPQTRYRILLNNLESNLVNTKIPSGTYTEYICAALGYCFASVKIIKKGLLAGETAIINFYHKEISDGHSEEPYMQLVMFNDTGVDGQTIEKEINLLPGTWTLVESNWAWTYTGEAEGEGSTTVDHQAAIVRKNLLDTSPADERTFTFTNRKTNTTNPAKESIKTNVMKPKQ